MLSFLSETVSAATILYNCVFSFFYMWNPKKSWWKLWLLFPRKKNGYKMLETIFAVSLFPWSPSKKSPGPWARGWESLLYKDWFSNCCLYVFDLCFSSPNQVKTLHYSNRYDEKLSMWEKTRDTIGLCFANLNLSLIFCQGQVLHLAFRVWLHRWFQRTWEWAVSNHGPRPLKGGPLYLQFPRPKTLFPSMAASTGLSSHITHTEEGLFLTIYLK